MISRAACVPRVCLACRLGLAQRSATARSHPLSPRLGNAARHYYSRLVLPDKSLIERIISGQVSDRRGRELLEKKRSAEQKQQKKERLPDWGRKKKVVNQTEEKVENLTEADTKSTIEPENPAENSFIFKSTGDSTPLSNLDQTQESNLPEDSKPGDKDGAFSSLELDHDSTPEIEILPRISRVDGDASQHGTNRKPGRKYPDNGLLQDKALNVSALGKPVSAIVIKNPNEIRATRGVTELEEMPRDPNSTPDWTKVILSKGKDPADEDGKDYLSYLEEMRPKDTRVLRLAEYQKLHAELAEGFITRQLREYYRATARQDNSGAEDLLDYSWITKQFPWDPSTNLPYEKETERQKFARRIIFQRWKLQIQDHVDGPGRAYVWVQPDVFPLLTRGSPSILDSLREEFLVAANDERMTTTTLESRINIQATKATTYGILDRIDEIMQRLRCSTLRLHRRIVVSRSELQELGRITNSTIKYINRGRDKDLEVRWLSEEEGPPVDTIAALRQEDPSEIVFRLLNYRRHPGLKHSAQTILPSESSFEDEGVLVDYDRDLKSLSWKEKLGSWTRLIQPINRESSTGPCTLRISKLADIDDSPLLDRDGGPLVTNDTVATFGSILHPYHGGANPSLNRRLLCPVVPHPAAFSALRADDNEPPKQTTFIILNFIPRKRTAPGFPSSAQGGGPDLRLRLPVNADADLSNFTMPSDATFDAVVPWRISDIMLPTNSVDVRIVHRRYLPLVSVRQGALRDFMSHSEFNLLAGRLRTPSRATFDIPRKYEELSYRGKFFAGEEISVPYLFNGLEIHQTAEMPWRGHTLRYSSIEAGHHGGQRQELSLQAGLPGTEVDFSGETRTSFLDLVEEIASGKAFSWDEGYKDMKRTLYEDHSYDLPEKPLGDDFVVTEVEAEQHAAEQSEKEELDGHDQSSVDGEETIPQSNAFSRFDDPDYYEEEVGLTPEEKAEMEREIDALLQLDSRPESSPKSGSVWPDMEEEEASVAGDGRREPSASEDTAWLFKNGSTTTKNEAGNVNEATSNEGSDLKGEVSSKPTSEEKSAEQVQGNANDTPVADAPAASSPPVPDAEKTISEADGSVDLSRQETRSGAESSQHDSGNKAEGAEEKGKN